jgi:hypothetical protein
MRSGIRIITIFILLFAVAASAASAGQEKDVEKLIEEGKQAYRNEEWSRAVEIFGKVINLIQKETTVALAEFVPEPPSGWTGNRIDVQTSSMSADDMSIAHSSVSRVYTRESDGSSAEIMISNAPSVYSSYEHIIRSMKNNPMMKAMAEQQGADMPRMEEMSGWDVIIATEHGDTEISAVHAGAVVTVSAENETDARMIIGLVDLGGLAAMIKEQNK